MKTLMLCTSRNFEDDLINEVEVRGSCGTHGGEGENSVQGLAEKI
jgi:hypothetical protein